MNEKLFMKDFPRRMKFGNNRKLTRGRKNIQIIHYRDDKGVMKTKKINH
ncbi:MAG: hypothetical protein M9892_07470 [Bacteroidetes bacterium]|nr:hypothetical protein [Bacteroidota bacterium]